MARSPFSGHGSSSSAPASAAISAPAARSHSAVPRWYGSLQEAVTAMTGEAAQHAPDEPTARRYDRLFEVYRELYPSTARLHRALQHAVEDRASHR